MQTFTQWLEENQYDFANTKPASEWKSIWLNIAKNYLKKMNQEGEEDLVDASIWRINQIAKKLEELGDQPLTANRVSIIASDENQSDNEELDAHFDELIDALERIE